MAAEYKQTPVGPVPVDWELKPLRAISPSQCVGVVVNPSDYFQVDGPVPFLVGSDVSEGEIDASSSRRISEASNRLLAKSRLNTGDLVMVRVGEPGLAAVVPPELHGANCASMMVVRQHRSFDSRWLCYAMNSHIGRSQVEGVQYGTAQKQFNISDAVNFQYPVPPLEEQRAIAAALSDVDGLLAKLDQLIAKKRDLKQAAMQQLLTGQRRLSGFSEPWGERALQSVVTRLEAGVSVRSVEGDAGGSECFVLKTSAIADGNFDASERKPVIPADRGRVRCPVRAGTVLVSRMNTPDLVGEVGFVDRDYLNIFLPDRLWAVLVPKGAVSARWLSYVLSSSEYKQRLRDVATGTSGSMKNISKGAFLGISVKVPTLDEQSAIAQVLSDMDAELVALEARRNKTRQLKQGMMQALLTGRIRLT